MYYTGAGDKGKTRLNNSKSLSKSEPIFELLGSLDQLNSLCGFSRSLTDVTQEIKDSLLLRQEGLFSCQAYFARSKSELAPDLLSRLERDLDEISLKLKPRHSFVIPGGSLLSASLDLARTQARSCERLAQAYLATKTWLQKELMLAYLNRLSSYFFVLARYANDLAGVEEVGPRYS